MPNVLQGLRRGGTTRKAGKDKWIRPPKDTDPRNGTFLQVHPLTATSRSLFEEVDITAVRVAAFLPV